MALHIIEKLMSNRLDVIFQDFVEVVKCFVVFAASEHSKLSLQALEHLAFCADKLASEGGTELYSKSKSITTQSSVDENGDSVVFRLWWPLLLGLATRVGDSRVEIRVKAFDTLHNVLKNYSKSFSVDVSR